MGWELFDGELLGLECFWDWGAFGWGDFFGELLFWGAFGGKLSRGAYILDSNTVNCPLDNELRFLVYWFGPCHTNYLYFQKFQPWAQLKSNVDF